MAPLTHYICRTSLLLLIIGSAAGCLFSSLSSNSEERDGGGEESGHIPSPSDPLATAVAVGEGVSQELLFVSVVPGTKLSLKGVVDCPKGALCRYSWDFGDGSTMSGKETGPRNYVAGFHWVRFSVENVNNELVGQAMAFVAAWNGTFDDDFEREAIRWGHEAWLRPKADDFEPVLRDGWLQTEHRWDDPAQSALLHMATSQNSQVELTLARSPHASMALLQDVLMRVKPEDRSSYYLVRVEQSAANEGEASALGLAVYKVLPELEQPILLSDVKQSLADWSALSDCPAGSSGCAPCFAGKCVPSECQGCARLSPFDELRQQHIRLKIDLRDDAGGVPTWNITLSEAQHPAEVLLEQRTIQDLTPHPLRYPGLVGISHVGYRSRVDDFQYVSKD